ncbi:MAG TPA: response regulator transcription factor [Rugosimonospora sp.]|nr:response regulator transcription factor [Rugosimonospora sp.]
MIRVAVADDQPLVRAGVRVILDVEDDIELVGEAADGAGAVALARRLHPDVLLMDVRMPGTDGLRALREIVGDPDLAGTRVVILTTFDLDEYVGEALRAGASGFLVKDGEPGELLRAIRVVAQGDALLSPSVTRRLLGQLAAPAGPVPPGLAQLTEREREVLGYVGQGLSNEEIGERLRISPATVRTHVSRGAVKLGARDRAQLVVIVYRCGLQPPG